jgi:hypothetical protein
MHDIDFEAARIAVERGEQAKNELALVTEACRDLRAAAVEAIINTHPNEVAIRERAIVTAQIIDEVKSILIQIIDKADRTIVEKSIEQLFTSER